MSFGFSVGDFISTGQLVWLVYTRCKSSVTEFKDLSREVASLNIVFDELARFWKTENQHGSDLSADQKGNLSRIVEGCREVLKDVEGLLEKHRKLGKGASLKARMRWACKDIGPIRNRLILQTTLLSAIHVAITANSNANSQAKVLDALNTMHRNHEIGTRTAPAFSRVTIDDLDQNANDIWEEVKSEIEEQGVDAAAVEEHRDFIKSWIDQVIVDEVEENDDYGPQSDGNPPWLSPAIPPDVNGVQPQHLDLSSLKIQDTAYAGTSGNTMPEDLPVLARSASFSSHRSKESNLHPTKGPNEEYVQRLLVKLLRPHVQVLNNKPVDALRAKRAFRQLDWSNRGFLYPHAVDDACRSALQHIGSSIFDIDFVELYETPNFTIDRIQFVGFIESLRARAQEVEDKIYYTLIQKDIQNGQQLLHGLPAESKGNILQWGWTTRVNHDPPTWGMLDSIFPEQQIQRHDPPMVDADSFTAMGLIASRICIPAFNRMLDGWIAMLIGLPRTIVEEYRKSLNAILVVSSKFLIFRTRNASSGALSDLDTCQALLKLGHPAIQSEWDSNLLKQLDMLQQKAFLVLSRVIAILADLAPDRRVDVRNVGRPMDIEHWRAIHVQDRAELLLAESSKVFQGALSLAKSCDIWVCSHESAVDNVARGVKNAFGLLLQQLELEELRVRKLQKEELRIRNAITFELIGRHGLTNPEYQELLEISFEDFGQTNSTSGDFDDDFISSSLFERTYGTHTNPYRIEKIHNRQVTAETVVNIRVSFGTYSALKGDTSLNPNTRSSGECQFRIGAIVKLNNPEQIVAKIPIRFEGGLDVEFGGGEVEIAITPHAAGVLLPPQRSVESIEELMTAINALPLSENWIRRQTSDGRFYFQTWDGSAECSESAQKLPRSTEASGPCTVAFPLPAQPEPMELAIIPPPSHSPKRRLKTWREFYRRDRDLGKPREPAQLRLQLKPTGVEPA